VPTIGTGKGAAMNGNGQTLWVKDKRNVRYREKDRREEIKEITVVIRKKEGTRKREMTKFIKRTFLYLV
jgi:hypothetical protein